jgi:hypothetical protein
MFEGVHDSLLVEYFVSSESEQLVLKLLPGNGSAPAPFKVIFHGVVAHCFEAPLLPAILSNIETISAETLIAENWPRIEHGQNANGWPGAWAASLVDATLFVRSSDLQGFNIESSYGLSGWVLAKSVERTAAG